MRCAVDADCKRDGETCDLAVKPVAAHNTDEENRLAHHCERMLRRTMTPRSALETLCVAQQLSREELKADTVRYIVDHFAPSIADGAMLSDAVEDFPQLGVSLLQAVAARVGERTAAQRVPREGESLEEREALPATAARRRRRTARQASGRRPCRTRRRKGRFPQLLLGARRKAWTWRRRSRSATRRPR